jgi:hypothetical protein
MPDWDRMGLLRYALTDMEVGVFGDQADPEPWARLSDTPTAPNQEDDTP